MVCRINLHGLLKHGVAEDEVHEVLSGQLQLVVGMP